MVDYPEFPDIGEFFASTWGILVIMLGTFLILAIIMIYAYSRSRSNCEKRGDYYSAAMGCMGRTTDPLAEGKCPNYYYFEGGKCKLDVPSVKQKDTEYMRIRSSISTHSNH